MSAKPDYVVSTLTRPTGAATGGFVINLTSSTTPMALSQPKDPTLAQYTFFVSRRREDGRERFRLHMGYFETMQAAEEMLNVVREVYPSAWAGEAPGKKLRANNPAAQAAAPAPAAPAPAPAAPVARAPAPAPTPPPPVAAKPAPAPVPAIQIPQAAATPPPPAAAPVARAPTPAPTLPPPVVAKPAPTPAPAAQIPAPVVAPPAPVAPPVAAKPAFEEPFRLSDDSPDFKPMNVPVVHPPVVQPEAKKVVSPPPAAPKAPAKAAARPAAAAKPATKPVQSKPAAAKPAPAKPPAVAPKIAAQVSAPALTAPAPTPPAPKAPPPEPTVQMPVPTLPMSAAAAVNNVRQVIEELDDLSDTQTIRLLERHSPYKEGSQEANADEAIRVIKPEDAQSMLAIKTEVKRNAPILFAVQLDWSVTPFDMSKISPLAIFNAYTLYTTEANREGRTWYGLRLGFFSDAVSAKQVAYYVRSDFKTVSVVPVTTVEKERATDLNAERSGIHRAANIKEGPAPTPVSLTSSNASGVFKLLEDDMPAHIAQDVDGEMSPRFSKPAASEKPAAPAVPAPPLVAATAQPTPEARKPASAKRKPGGKGARRDASAQVDEETLDQTLEILGASTLEIQTDKTGDTGVRHLRVKIDKKGSKFASLIDRLSGKKPNPF